MESLSSMRSNWQLEKPANGKGGIWRIPPSFDGHTRSPLPLGQTNDPKSILAFYVGTACRLEGRTPLQRPCGYVAGRLGKHPKVIRAIFVLKCWCIPSAVFELVVVPLTSMRSDASPRLPGWPHINIELLVAFFPFGAHRYAPRTIVPHLRCVSL